MFKVISTIFIVFAASLVAFADHGPRIQFVHNSASALAQSVDIWITYQNSNMLPVKYIENLNYKEATEYFGSSLIFGDLVFYVTPAGDEDTSNNFIKKAFGTPEIDYEMSYIIVISGDPENNFDLILTDANETGNFAKTSVKVFHGSNDAPAINIVETSVPAGLLFENLSYSQSQGYLDLNSENYEVQIQTLNGEKVANFSLPLSFFNAQPILIVASGYIDTSGSNPNNPFKLLIVETNGTVTELNAIGQNTPPRVQIIHNSASIASKSVDIWISNQTSTSKLISDFNYKDATPFIDAPELFTVSVTAAGSIDTANAVLHKDFILNRGTSYVLIAAGDPGTNFDLFYSEAKEGVNTSGRSELLVFHGSVGAPTIDIDEVSIPAGIIVNDLAFGDIQGYISLQSIDYSLQIKTQEGIGAAEFSVPLSAFSDSALVVVASGYLDTIGNTPNNPFKLLAITPSGIVTEINPRESLTPARIQIIHNSAVPSADFVDVYMDDEKIIDNFAFRTATPFIEVPGSREFTVDIDTKNSLDNSFPIYSETLLLESGRTYIVVASGVIVFGSENYFPLKPFDLIPILDAREESREANKVDVMVFHGATDVPMVDINEISLPIDELVNDISYGESAGYLELGPAKYELEVALASSSTSVNKYTADVSSLSGQALTILASGFLDPIKNNNGASLGLWVALAEGGDLIELPSLITSVNEPLIGDLSMMLYPNPASHLLNVDLTLEQQSEVKIYLHDLRGIVQKSIDYGNLQNSNQSFSINIKDMASGLYILSVQAGQSIISKKVQINN